MPDGVTQQDAHGVRRRSASAQSPPLPEPVLERRDEFAGDRGIGTPTGFVALGGQVVDERHGAGSRDILGKWFGVQPHQGEMTWTGGLDDLPDEHAGDGSGEWGWFDGHGSLRSFARWVGNVTQGCPRSPPRAG